MITFENIKKPEPLTHGRVHAVSEVFERLWHVKKVGVT